MVRKIFQPFDGRRELMLREKLDLFFKDYSMMEFLVQQNYLHVVMNTDKKPAL